LRLGFCPSGVTCVASGDVSFPGWDVPLRSGRRRPVPKGAAVARSRPLHTSGEPWTRGGETKGKILSGSSSHRGQPFGASDQNRPPRGWTRAPTQSPPPPQRMAPQTPPPGAALTQHASGVGGGGRPLVGIGGSRRRRPGGASTAGEPTGLEGPRRGAHRAAPFPPGGCVDDPWETPPPAAQRLRAGPNQLAETPNPPPFLPHWTDPGGNGRRGTPEPASPAPGWPTGGPRRRGGGTGRWPWAAGLRGAAGRPPRRRGASQPCGGGGSGEGMSDPPLS